MYRIMIVEDDEKLARLLGEELGRYGYEAVWVDGRGDVREAFALHKPDLVLLDVNLPRFDGYHWCRELRKVTSVPIVFLSARSDALDQVRALENGGDDYITKPFNLELAIAKVQSVLRRAYGEYSRPREPDLLQAGPLLLDRGTNRVRLGEREVELAPKEFRLLWLLAEGGGRIVGRDELFEALWDDVDFVDDNTLTVNVARLRRRLAELGLERAIETKRGQGYRLAVEGMGGPP